MAPKRAKFYSYGQDSLCAEVKEFIEKAGVLLEVRDIEKEPLSAGELTHLFRHIDIKHFLNTLSDAYTHYRLDKNLPPREKIIELMAQDHSLIRRPIVQSARLLTVGCDKRKIAEMLQINASGEASTDDTSGFGNRRNRNNRTVSAASGK
jgi:arsenate reductase-like glutaredoxin family protein